MKWQQQECGSADADTPEDHDPLEIVQKTMASIG
jgi:hypothetical protein